MLKNIDMLISNVKKTPIKQVEKRLVAATPNEMYAIRIDLVLNFNHFYRSYLIRRDILSSALHTDPRSRGSVTMIRNKGTGFMVIC